MRPTLDLEIKPRAAAPPKPTVKRSNTSVLGKGFDLLEGQDAPSIASQIAAGLKANSAKVLDLFREMDKSGDGQVSKQEFRKEMAEALHLDIPQNEIDDLFNAWDVNQNGYLEFDELKRILGRSAK